MVTPLLRLVPVSVYVWGVEAVPCVVLKLARPVGTTVNTGVGVGVTSKSVAPKAPPPGVVTAIRLVPVEMFGTVAVMVVASTTVNALAETPLNVTAVAPVKLVPVIVTLVPTGPLVGLKLVMVGGEYTVKVPEAVYVVVPSLNTTAALPMGVALATVAVTLDALADTLVAATPAKVTPVILERLLPLIVTTVPTGPLVGVKLVIDGVEDATPVTTIFSIREVPPLDTVFVPPVTRILLVIIQRTETLVSFAVADGSEAFVTTPVTKSSFPTVTGTVGLKSFQAPVPILY